MTPEASRSLSPDDLAAIRARDSLSSPDSRRIGTVYRDRRALLAEVDRLRRVRTDVLDTAREDAVAAERARIRAAVDGLLDPDTGKSWNHALNTVLRIIDGGEG